MVPQKLCDPLGIENVYCASPQQCRKVDVLFVGSGIALSCAPYLLQQTHQARDTPLRIAVVDAGPFDLLTRMAHTAFPHVPLLQQSSARPRTPSEALSQREYTTT